MCGIVFRGIIRNIRDTLLLLIFLTVTIFTLSAQRVLGFLNDDNVRMRTEPSLVGIKLGLLSYDESVEILDISAEKMKIADMNSYWYTISLYDNTVGWTDGHFVDVSKNDLLNTAIRLERLDLVIELLQSDIHINQVFDE